MLDFEKITRYKKYINSIQALLDKYFESQAEYICCKKGCSYCCEKGVYPYSELEFQYLTLGVLNLPNNEKSEVLDNISKLKEEYKNFSGDKFLHKCPFLKSDKTCAVYDYRGIICRNFGILQINDSGKVFMPFCQEHGLNYSKVYNNETKNFDFNKVEELGYTHIPKPFPVSRELLMDNSIFEEDPLDFGESKALIEWL